MKIKYADLNELNYFAQEDLFTGITSVDEEMKIKTEYVEV